MGSGAYPAGTMVTVSSNKPADDMQFASWTPARAGLNNPYWPIATCPMPAEASTLTATYSAAGNPPIPDGTYKILALWDGLSLAASGMDAGAHAQQQAFTGAANQQWNLKNLGNNEVELTLRGTEHALSVAEAAKTAGGILDVEVYTGAASQRWMITPILGTAEIVNVNSGMAVNISGYQKQAGVQLVQDTAGYVANQVWSFYPITP